MLSTLSTRPSPEGVEVAQNSDGVESLERRASEVETVGAPPAPAPPSGLRRGAGPAWHSLGTRRRGRLAMSTLSFRLCPRAGAQAPTGPAMQGEPEPADAPMPATRAEQARDGMPSSQRCALAPCKPWRDGAADRLLPHRRVKPCRVATQRCVSPDWVSNCRRRPPHGPPHRTSDAWPGALVAGLPAKSPRASSGWSSAMSNGMWNLSVMPAPMQPCGPMASTTADAAARPRHGPCPTLA